MQEPTDSPSFYQALTLRERAILGNAEEEWQLTVIDPVKAAKRFERWRSQAPFTEARLLIDRLGTDGIAVTDFRGILGCPPDVLMKRCRVTPEWLTGLCDVFEMRRWHNSRHGPADGPPVSGLVQVITPFLRYAEECLAQAAAGFEVAAVPFTAATITPMLVARLVRLLVEVAQRTMTLELHVARVRDELAGDSPERRFEHFFRRFTDRDTSLALYSEYPVLARLLWSRTKDWIVSSREFLSHLATDWPAIVRDLLGNRHPGRIRELQGDAGDSHRGGRAVMIVVFENGSRLVYKPRSLETDRHFSELLAWCVAEGWRPAFRHVGIISRSDHGWVEFVEHAACKTESEVQTFYTRLGALLAVLYLLCASDMHYENVIAAGSHPVLVDLEALFHPQVSQFTSEASTRFSQSVFEQTVMRVGLLPLQVVMGSGPGLDVSGMWGAAGQPLPFLSQAVQHPGTDSMRVVPEQALLRGGLNRPRVGDRDVRVEEYSDDCVRGFTEMYQFVHRHRAGLLAKTGPLRRFRDDEIRLLIRPTWLYARMRAASFHPDVLRDALDRDRLLDRLWVGVNRRPAIARLIAGERADLERADIPIFTTRVASRDLRSGTGVLIENALASTGLENAISRIEQMGESDLARQVWAIRASLASLEASARPEGEPATTPLRYRCDPPLRSEYIEAASVVGRRVAAAAYSEDGKVTWLNLASLQRNSWTLLPAAADLYNGLAGICLFFAYLAELTGSDEYKYVASKTLHTALAMVEAVIDLDMPLRIGAFSAGGGIIFVLCHLGSLWEDPELLSLAERIATHAGKAIEDDENCDFMSGAAGYACVLECLYGATGSRAALEQAYRCGRSLLQRAKRYGDSLGWPLSGWGGVALTGMSHGADGIALALVRVAQLTGEREFMAAAEDALRFTDAHFDAAVRNWVDLRPGHNGPAVAAWCHGAAGIGLARLQCLPFIRRASLVEDVDMALEATSATGFGRGHCLCHGDLGNAQFLCEAGLALNRPELIIDGRLRAGDCLAGPWRCGTPAQIETPSLMTGLSGIGYELLRLAEPGLLPSVLTLDPVSDRHSLRNRSLSRPDDPAPSRNG
jgi:type 2 lantibiotic biosynthesis protein LanM